MDLNGQIESKGQRAIQLPYLRSLKASYEVG